MAYVTNISTVITYDLDGSTNIFNIPFEYLSRSFVVITLIGSDRRILTLGSEYSFLTTTSIQTTATWNPESGYEQIEIRRQTSATERLVDFQNGSVLRANDLNVSQIQSMHIAEEARDLVSDTIGTTNDGDLDARGRQIVNLADGVDPGDAVTMRQEQAWAGSALNQANIASTQAGVATTQAGIATSKATQASSSQVAAAASEVNSHTSELNAAVSSASALASKNAASISETNAASSATTAASEADRATTEADRLAEFNDIVDRINSVAVAEVGEVLWHHSRSNMKVGCVAGDGQLLSRATYPELWNMVNTGKVPVVTESSWLSDITKRGAYTSGDGSTTFRVPDYNGAYTGSIKGLFIRGDSGITSNNGIVSSGSAPNITANLAAAGAVSWQSPTGSFTTSGSNSASPAGNSNSLPTQLKFDASISSGVYKNGVAEITPNNISGCYVIRVFGSVNNPGSVDGATLATRIEVVNTDAQASINSRNVKVFKWTEAVAAGWISTHSALNSASDELMVAIYPDRIVVEGIIRVTGNAISTSAVMYKLLKVPTGWTDAYKGYCIAMSLGATTSPIAFTRSRTTIFPTSTQGINVDGFTGNATTVFVNDTWYLK